MPEDKNVGESSLDYHRQHSHDAVSVENIELSPYIHFYCVHTVMVRRMIYECTRFEVCCVCLYSFRSLMLQFAKKSVYSPIYYLSSLDSCLPINCLRTKYLRILFTGYFGGGDGLYCINEPPLNKKKAFLSVLLVKSYIGGDLLYAVKKLTFVLA